MWNRNPTKVVDNHINIVAFLRRNRNNRCSLGNSVLDKLLDILLLPNTLLLISNNDVDFVLQDYDLVEVHDLNSCQVLTGLRLRTRLVASHEEQRTVHDGGTGQHGCH